MQKHVAESENYKDKDDSDLRLTWNRYYFSVQGSIRAGACSTELQFLGKSCISGTFFLHLGYRGNEGDSIPWK